MAHVERGVNIGQFLDQKGLPLIGQFRGESSSGVRISPSETLILPFIFLSDSDRDGTIIVQFGQFNFR